jgi:trans-2,3-dihydro-3-hydroxyanthranilate isomerase
MRKQFELYHIKAFTKNPFEGNAAAVLFGDELTEHRMQQIATKINYPETAFINTSSEADFKLRWFSPSTEVELCGHATIAALHFLSEIGVFERKDSITFETRSGKLKCFSSNAEYSIEMPVYSISELFADKNQIISAYKIPIDIIDIDTPVLTLSNNYVFIKIKSYDKLISYKPDFEADYSIVNKYPDISLYTTETIEANNAAHHRFFSPGSGIIEDPVTGSGSAYLAMVLLRTGSITESMVQDSITIEQGDHLGKKGRIKVSFDRHKDLLVIKGNAVTFLKENIFI